MPRGWRRGDRSLSHSSWTFSRLPGSIRHDNSRREILIRALRQIERAVSTIHSCGRIFHRMPSIYKRGRMQNNIFYVEDI